MRIFIIIATLGRPALVRGVVDRLARQHRIPDGIVVVATESADVRGLSESPARPDVLITDKGSCRQRNAGLEHVGERADVVIFLDDDFVAADNYTQQVERLLTDDEAIVGVTGTPVADGVSGPGIAFADAARIVEADIPPETPIALTERALYGCNMAVRLSVAGDLRFDEALPLYGWLEDIDYSYRLGRRGRLVRSNQLRGVHLGHKSGRTSGVRLGYSQVANPIYMLSKRSAPPRLAIGMLARNLVSNVLNSIRPEPYIDRRGRLRGNLLALAHLITGRINPRHILSLGRDHQAS